MNRRVRWDEEKLQEIESNKPVRQKITEPKTPYHPMIDDDGFSPVGRSFNDCIDDAMDAKELSSVKDVASPSRKTTGCSGSWTSSADEAGGAMDYEEDWSSKRFQEQRKAHYDEYFKIKELRGKGSLLEEEDGVEGDSSSSLRSGFKDVSRKDGTVTLPGTSSARPATG
ncbi:inhibitor-2 [Hibiscus trionum]|uniref:Inhibitor-2 n=1 Tax=Hibiscus trionum TaxID=183268 RepID=A0A9W7H6I5_HIBTR|nr:inhibitor-2 [Hibiscus trionum]